MDEHILGLREEVSEGSVMRLQPPLMYACSNMCENIEGIHLLLGSYNEYI